MGSWPWTSIAAYVLWWGIPLAVLGMVFRKGRLAGPGGKVPAAEISLAIAFNAIAAAVLGGVVLPRMLRSDFGPEVPWLFSLPFLPYGLAGFACVRSLVEAKRSAIGRAIAVYAFSALGHLVGGVLLLAYLRAVVRAGGP